MPIQSRIDDARNRLETGQEIQASGGTSYFSGARKVTLTNSNITHVQGDYFNTISPNTGLLGSLERHISQDAMFDSAARYPAGQCHPGTRTAIIREIRTWVDDPNPEHDIFWLHGSAGVGKSALMQTIAQILHEANNGRYAGSFFFGNGIAGREECSFLFPTLAYQLAVNLPEIRPLIEAALMRDSTIPAKSMPAQIKALLVDPFNLSPIDFSQHTPTVIIDGLDECRGSASQIQILNCISDALSSRIPLRFLIASRPEHGIESAFARVPLVSNTRPFSLNDPFHVSSSETYTVGRANETDPSSFGLGWLGVASSTQWGEASQDLIRSQHREHLHTDKVTKLGDLGPDGLALTATTDIQMFLEDGFADIYAPYSDVIGLEWCVCA